MILIVLVILKQADWSVVWHQIALNICLGGLLEKGFIYQTEGRHWWSSLLPFVYSQRLDHNTAVFTSGYKAKKSNYSRMANNKHIGNSLYI